MSHAPLVLCAVDFSPPSAEIVRHAAAFAAGPRPDGDDRAPLTLVHVIEPLLVQAAAMSEEAGRLQEECRKALAALAATVASPDTAQPAALDVRVGLAHVEILKAAADTHASLIVMGSQGHGGAARIFFGSTTQRVLRETVTPTLVVPSGAGVIARDGADGPALRVLHVVAAVDFSDTTGSTVAAAARLAQRTGATLTLAHVVPPAHALERWGTLLDEHHAQRVRKAGDELAMLSQELRGRVADVRVAALEGEPERTLAALADEQAGTLVVMGVRRGGGLLGPQPGSTAYRVLCLARTPVLIVPARLR